MERRFFSLFILDSIVYTSLLATNIASVTPPKILLGCPSIHADSLRCLLACLLPLSFLPIDLDVSWLTLFSIELTISLTHH